MTRVCVCVCGLCMNTCPPSPPKTAPTWSACQTGMSLLHALNSPVLLCRALCAGDGGHEHGQAVLGAAGGGGRDPRGERSQGCRVGLGSCAGAPGPRREPVTPCAEAEACPTVTHRGFGRHCHPSEATNHPREYDWESTAQSCWKSRVARREHPGLWLGFCD